jgi:N-acyl-D-amino-acid deacylase
MQFVVQECVQLQPERKPMRPLARTALTRGTLTRHVLTRHALTRTALLLSGVIISACRTAPAGAPDRAGSYDVIIANGHIVDGTGAAWFAGDLAIRGTRIARIAPAGMLSTATARQRIDATGMVVAPGFIDIQGQSVGQLTAGDSRLVSTVTQGITTEILGEGETPAPQNDKTAPALLQFDSGFARIVRTFTGPHGFGRWLETMQQHGGSVNVGSFLGAGTIRAYAKGFAQGDPTPAELDTMREMTRRAMADGAYGVASALIYPPGNYATTNELVEIAKAMSPFGGVYITHMRSEGDELLPAIEEALRIGREGHVPVEIYHLKAAGKRNWPSMALAIAKIDSARAAGQDISADMYPYPAGATGLAACIPPWAAADGKLLDNMRNPEIRARAKRDMLTERMKGWENLCQLGTPEGVMVVGLTAPEDTKYEGMRLSQIAEQEHKDWVDALIDVTLREKGGAGQVNFMASEDNLALQLKQPWIKIGTDADGWDPDSAHGIMVHPRTYGNYPRILGHFVRDLHVIPLEDAVRKMTSAVADRLSIQDRGLLREGMYADVVVFDPATVADRATFEKPHQLSVGVLHVLVNGVEVVRDGKHTGAKPGMVLRGPGWRP